MSAQAEVINSIPCDPYDLPDGTGVIQLVFDGSALAYHRAPGGLKCNGRVYGKSSYNSDSLYIVYRTDKPVAFNL